MAELAPQSISLAAFDAEAKRLAQLPETEYAVELQRAARELDLPATTLDRRVQLYRAPDDVVVLSSDALGKRLAKLVFLLGSDDSETVFAGARQIGRALEAGGRDWNSLSLLMQTAEPNPDARSAVEAQKFIDACTAILNSPGLRPNEHGFISDMRTRWELDWNFQPTQKQKLWFVSLL